MKQTGRPPNAIKELCQEYVFNDKLIEILAGIAKDTTAKAGDRIKAIEVLVDRGYGKPNQPMTGDVSIAGRMVLVSPGVKSE